MKGQSGMEAFGHRKPKSEKLLVTGVDGVVGANLALALADRFAVVGFFQHEPVAFAGCTTALWQPADATDWMARIRRQRPRWVIHCGLPAHSSWDAPQPSPDGEQEARTCALLAETCAETGARLTVISTDAVFDGPRLFHAEDDFPDSRQPFARAVRQAEQPLEATDALVVRTHAYGWGPEGTRPGFAERVWQRLIEGSAARFDPDRHATPILATHLAELLHAAYRRGLAGRRHIAGAERTSAYRFAVELAAAFGLARPARSAEKDPPARENRGPLRETSLSTLLARRELGVAMPMLREGLDGFAKQARNGFRARLQCGGRHAALAADVA